MPIRYNDPLQSFRFLVQVAGSGVVAAFTKLSGIQMQVQTIEGRTGSDNRGVATYEPVMTRFSPVTLSRGVVGDYDFMDWLLAAAAGDISGPTGQQYKRDIDIIALNDLGQPGVIWTLVEALPIGYEVSPMDASRSEVLMENITFAIVGLKRTANEYVPSTNVVSVVKRGTHSPPGLTVRGPRYTVNYNYSGRYRSSRNRRNGGY